MKKLLILILTCFITVTLYPQKTKQMHIVGKPQLLPNEMVAKQDANGEYAAAIQVISELEGLSYDANDGMVTGIDHWPGKDMVYVTHRERMLYVYKQGYEPFKIILSDHGIVLKSRQVWEVKISGDETADVLPVTFRFTPADATLFIDGKNAGKELTQNLNVGEHQIRLEKAGYQTIEKTVTVNEKQVFFQWQMEDDPDAGLQITTTPAGATILLDGVRIGESPVAAFYPPGTYPIKISKEGYVTIENETLEVKVPQTRKSYTLDENVGYLTINTNPGATIYFNDQKINNPKNVKLAPQLVKVKVTMPKAETLEQQVALKLNDKLSLDMFSNVQTGTLQVALTPFDAKIELTGDAGEKYTAEGMKIFEEIPVGVYTIKVSAAGYTAATETATVKQDETTKKTINLVKINAGNTSTGGATATSDDGIEMIFVKGGTFTMGCTSEQSDCSGNEKPTHQVTLSDFQIGKYQVTQKQWREVMGASTLRSNPSYYKGCDDCPVENVSWKDATEYCKWLRSRKTGKLYRLPTEAEWEYAARGGASTSSATGATKYAGSNNINEVAWYSGNSYSKTHPVGQKKPNKLGIYDMSGNVWEWCSDLYGNYSSGSQTNPNGASTSTYRVLRGGSWYDSYGFCRVALRNLDNPVSRSSNFGFRLAQDF
ncbi:MAG TPA: SUMF1/EgtB/PvdO family nonheme iron enzyme [Bacteroidales bacterium]|nr:SUMF1/EgtB/PvdO family nonheme iron enzyme [Bacteroidales bacterium]